MVDWV